MAASAAAVGVSAAMSSVGHTVKSSVEIAYELSKAGIEQQEQRVNELRARGARYWPPQRASLATARPAAAPRNETAGS